jgi:O-antigen ligase
VKAAHAWRTLREGLAPDPVDGWDVVAFLALLTLLAAAPLLYGIHAAAAARRAIGGGEVAHFGNLLIEICAFSVGTATLLSRSQPRSFKTLAIPLAAVLALAGLGLAQIMPLPEGFLERAAPASLKTYHESAQILRVFGRPAPLPRISIAPTSTAGTVLLVLADIALFLCTATLARSRFRRRLCVGVLTGSAVLQVLAAAVRESTENRLHGLLPNADLFAGYLEIALAFAFGAFWTEVLTGSDRTLGATSRAERFEKRSIPIVVRILAWGVLAVGIGLTRSRGGILSAGIVTAVLLAMAFSHRHDLDRKAAVGGGLALLAGATVAAITAGQSVAHRFLELDPRDLGGNVRITLWKTSLAAWREFPWLGSGLGTFREAFRRVQPRDLPGLIEQAHADALQLLVTGGAIGAAFGIVAFGGLFFLLAKAWRNQRHREESALTLAGFGALLSLTLHGLVDFNLSIPSVAATLACALGIAWAAGMAK